MYHRNVPIKAFQLFNGLLQLYLSHPVEDYTLHVAETLVSWLGTLHL